jgi:phosphoglycolate phosphatase-like HAD superfamily hydrolase
LAGIPGDSPANQRDCLPGPVDALFFDLGGVLYDDTLWRRWLLQLLSHMGLHTNYTSFFRVWEHEFGEDVAWECKSYWPAMKRFLAAAGLSPSQAEEVEAAGRARLRQLELNIRPFPQVLPTLRQLRAHGVLLGVWSSLPLTTSQMERTLERLGMMGLFAVTCSPRLWKRTVTPPDRMQAALHSASVDPAHAAYVGRQRLELLAAEHIGLRTMAFNPDPDAQAQTELAQFSQLLGVVAASEASYRAAG